ncbi:MAG: hypothetical protein NTU53_17920 [Planctomycetota bacterium]|nr:hypothetical protein [Planctomycetota bacterium]
MSYTTGQASEHGSDGGGAFLKYAPIGHGTERGTASASKKTDAGSTGGLTMSTVETPRKELVGGRSGKGHLDSGLLDRAQETIESIDTDDAETLLIRLQSLGGIACELWRAAASSSQYHRQILAAFESAVLTAIQAEGITSGQLRALRAAVIDLRSPVLTQGNVDSIASHLIDEQYSPLAILSEHEENDG